jgi:methylenetetrahydrofolate reductase (NADPH)
VNPAASSLEALVRAGTFCVTSEVVPPRSADPSPLDQQARELVGYADAVNVTDNPVASAHMSPLAGVAAVARAGLAPTVQLTVRDRNRLALAGDLLGAWALGARNLFALTGDPVSAGDEPSATAVHDVTVLELISLARTLRNDHRMSSGQEIDPAPAYFVGVSDTPLVEVYDPGRLEAKLDAGADFVITQITYDLEAIVAWADVVRERGILERAAVLVGVAPLRGGAQARYMNEHLPGVSVPDELVAALDAAGPDAEAVGTARCVEVVTGLREIDGISGVHVMGLGRETVVRHVIEGAGLFPRPIGGRD